MRKPDFENILKVLNKEKPKRPTLFEFFMNEELYADMSGGERGDSDLAKIKAFEKLGYDYATIMCGFSFPRGERNHEQSISLNEGVVITDRRSFESYPWPEIEEKDYKKLHELHKIMPAGMKAIVPGPGGVLENLIGLVGFDNLCMMLADDPGLAGEITDCIGSRLLAHYEACLRFDIVGAIISNDDWGFKTQTMLSPGTMRRLITPWHRKIARAAHATGKPVILHSCGNLRELTDDIIGDIRYDGKHSYEDVIKPVEDAYEELCGKIAVLGGIDMDFLCKKSEREVYDRSKAMLARSSSKGGYALGSGNSIPSYVPRKNYLAMISAAM